MLTLLSFYKDMVFESDLNVGADFVIYSGDWNVTINNELDNKNYINVIIP